MFLFVDKRRAEEVRKALLEKRMVDNTYTLIKEGQGEVGFPLKRIGRGEADDLMKKYNGRIKNLGEGLAVKRKKSELPRSLKELSSRYIKKSLSTYETIGGIAIVELPEGITKEEEHAIGNALLKMNRNIKGVYAKAGKYEGIFRTRKLRLIAGTDNKETIHRENNVLLKLNVEEVYFSPRLASERKRIFSLVRPEERVLVMFSGCGPYVFEIAKNTEASSVAGIEINPVAHRYALENMKLNHAYNVELYGGDVRDVIPVLKQGSYSFDRIVMPLPKGADDFLDVAFEVAKEGACIHMYDFLREEDIPDAAEDKVKNACLRQGWKPEILRTVKCGQYGPHIYRTCTDFRVSR